MIIEPCCANKQLPRLLTGIRNNSVTFQTHGDVLFERLYKAIACFVTDPCVMVLTINDCDTMTYRLLRQCFDREWISHLIIATHTDNSIAIRRELAPYLDRISHTASTLIGYHSEQMLLYGKSQQLLLQGPLLLVQRPQLTQYSLAFRNRADSPHKGGDAEGRGGLSWFIEAVAPVLARHRVKPLIQGDDPQLQSFLHQKTER